MSSPIRRLGSTPHFFSMPNPYQPVESAGSARDAVCVTGDPSSPLSVRLIEQGVLRRRVELFGKVNAMIGWSAMDAHEYVAVNGRRVVQQFATLWNIPRFEFELRCNGILHRFQIDVMVRWIYLTRAFRISIDGRAIYREGDCTRFDEAA